MTENDILNMYPGCTYESVGSGYMVNNGNYYIYIPKDLNSTTPSVLSYHGSDGAGGSNAAIPYLSSNDVDKIVVFPVGGYNYYEDDDTNQKMNSIINNVYQYKGLSSPGTTGSVGFSAGGVIAVNEYIQTLRANPDSIPYPCVLIDPAFGGEHLVNSLLISDDDYAYLASRDAMFVCFEEPLLDSSYNAKTVRNYEKICQKGINILVFWGDGDHGLQRDKAFGTCAFDIATGDFDALNNLKGDVTFTGYNGTNTLKGYNSIQFYDKETGTFREVSIDEAFSLLCENCNYMYGATNSIDGIHILEKIYKDLNKLGEFSLEFADGIDDQIKSYYEYLIEQMNNFRRAIRDTASLDGLSGLGFTSSTKSHELANNCIQQYYKGAFDLLRKVSDETIAAVNTGINFENADVKLSKLADDLTETGEATSLNVNQNDKSSYNPNPSSPSGNGTGNGGGGGSGPSVTPASEILDDDNEDDDEDDENNSNFYDTFYDFDELSSNDDLIVYEKADNCKLIIHKNEYGEVTGLEHFYSLDDSKDVNAKVDELNEKYKDNIYFDKIVTKDNQIKVIFNEKYYKDRSLEDLKTVYSDLKEVKVDAI